MLVGLILNEYPDCEVLLMLGCWDFFVTIIDGKGTITLRPDGTWAEVRWYVQVILNGSGTFDCPVCTESSVTRVACITSVLPLCVWSVMLAYSE